MAPRPEIRNNGDVGACVTVGGNNSGYRLSHPPLGEEVVISGLSGCFPDSNNVNEFGQNLFNKVDLLSDDDRRWESVHPEIPQRTGKIFHINHFDASFFGISFNQAQSMDPMCRIMLEKTYEAIIDAGVNPQSLKANNTGVFMGTCFSESEKTWIYENAPINGSSTTGCSRSMLANRISYWLDIRGPSFTMDSACSSSLYVMELAYKAIRDGHCDSAIIGACNLCLHPFLSLQFSRLGVLSPDGCCRSFDNDACGYARSEAVVAVFLQRAKDARRAYAQVLHVKINCDGFKEQGITYPAGNVQKKLLKELYEESEINPAEVEFVEAHATGTKVGDPEELIALDEIFCSTTKRPLKIGSVKSNMGHAEPASGMCSIAKLCIAYNTGYLPPNLHYKTPRDGVDAFVAGRLKVVTEKTPWNKGLAGVNSFGFGGANAHALLKNIAKPKINNGSPKDNLTRLVCVSGRTESAMKRILNDLISRPNVDAEQIGLIHGIHEQEIPGHGFRGYSLIRSHGENKEVVRKIHKYFPGKKPVGFIFTGLGSDWSGMGRDFMEIPVFAKLIERCNRVIKPTGINLVRLLCDEKPTDSDDILNSFVGIVAIQMGLYDVLKSIGVEPDFIMGHGIGELCCAYADGCFHAEEVILAAYYSGLACLETLPANGSMAEVELGYETIKSYCPQDIDIACHNGWESCIISGPAHSVRSFVVRLQTRAVHARELPYSKLPFHSRYMKKAEPTLLNYLKELLPKPKTRSKNWYSTSVPQHNWENDQTTMCSSAAYHTNSLLNPVLFEETIGLIPKEAITIEIGSNDCLQAIWKRSLKSEGSNISLIRKGAKNQFEFMLTTIGKLFSHGLNPTIAKLYPEIQFPVSSGTPSLSPLVEWNHTEDWFVTSFKKQIKKKSGERRVKIDVADQDVEYMAGHVIDGRNLYPATGYLVLVWETLALLTEEMFTDVSVTFENVKFMRATNIPKEGTLEFIVMIQKGSGKFEITESGVCIVSGIIQADKNRSQNLASHLDQDHPSGDLIKTMTTKDVYKELRLRGYNYSGAFKGITQSNITGTKGELMWLNNWVTFLDTMLQMMVLSVDTRGLLVPTSIRKLSIDTSKHYSDLSTLSDDQQKRLPVTVDRDIDLIRSGGVEIRGLGTSSILKRNPTGIPVLEKYQFIPFFPKEPLETKDTVRTYVQLILENVQTNVVKALELIDTARLPNSEPLTPLILESLEDMPLIKADVSVVSKEELNPVSNISNELKPEINALLIVGSGLLECADVLPNVLTSLNENGFVMSRESPKNEFKVTPAALELIASTKTESEQLVLLRKKPNIQAYKFLHVENSEYSWMGTLKDMLHGPQKVVLVSEGDELNGIIGLVNCLRKEPGGSMVSCVAVMDKNAPKFCKDLALFKNQLEKQLSINIYKNGQWGSYRHLLMDQFHTVKADHAYLNALTYGDLSSLRWIQGGINLHDEKKLVHVYYSALNFRDTMMASGRISLDAMSNGRLAQDCSIGMEFSGRTKNGVRVMGMSINRSMANVISAECDMLWPIPEQWTLEEGATIPVAYATIFYAFFVLNKFKPGCRVLIHAGAGGVGQAAIRVCLFYGCEIFTTVGTQAKRDFIRKMFPKIKESHIGNSRDTSFEDMIMKETNGEGVDYVLNSLAEEKLQASVGCLGFRGKFLEIGKFDILNNHLLGLKFFSKERSFQGIVMDLIMQNASKDRIKIHKLIMDHIRNGCIKPICRIIFDTNEAEKAFRFMSSGKHIGKVLIRIRPEEKERNAKPEPICLDALPRFYCHPECSYILVGGLGGFGLELTDWLVLRGARKIVLNSRRGVVNGYQSFKMKTWSDYGVQVIISKEDVSTRKGCEDLLQKAAALGPVSGIFNLAVLLKDAIFENQTPEMFKTSLAPKAVATKLLDVESRRLCPNLKNFVVFSSVSCGRGNAGQTNYGMANSIMERICEERQKAGYPALAIQWGAVGEVGLVADMQEEHMELEIGGTLQQRISSCLSVMDTFLSQSAPVVSSMVVAEKKATGACIGDVVGTVASILGLKDLKTVSPEIKLAELGMDSIMAVEIRQIMEREFNIITTPQDVRMMTFARLVQLAENLESPENHVSPVDSKANDIGLGIFVRNLGEEDQAYEAVLEMPTMIIENICKTTPKIFMVPGIEGMAVVFESLCKKLHCEASVLQIGYDHPEQDIASIAKRFLEPVRSTLLPSSEFIILGYSFGTDVTLEMAKALESEGHVGKIVLIDGSPEFVYSYVKANLRSWELDVMQNGLLSLLFDIFSPKSKVNILAALKTCSKWDEKVGHFIRNLPSDNKYSKGFLRKILTSIFKRLHSIPSYNLSSETKLKSDAILLRPKNLPAGVAIEENYCLNKYFEKSVKVHMLEGDHSSIIDNENCANIINEIVADRH